MKEAALRGEINTLLLLALVAVLAYASWIFLTSLIPEKPSLEFTYYKEGGYDIYTSMLPTTTELFSVDGINSFIKVKNGEVKEFSFESGTYLKFKNKQIVKISKPVDMSLKFISENEILFSIDGEGLTSIYLYNLNPDFSYIVKRDGKLFTDWQLIDSTMIIKTALSKHIFEIFGTNESILWNKANDSISVYLLMKVQWYNQSSGKWEDEAIVYNSSDPINLSANETIKLDQYFNGKWNTSQASHGSGLYRVWVAALNEEGEVIVNKDGSSASSTYNFTISDTTPPIISNINVLAITGSSATITWETNELATSLVKYGNSSGIYTYTKDDSTLTTSHSITLTNLTPNTTYYFVVNSTDASGNSNQSSEYNFTTKPYLVPLKRLNLSAVNSTNKVIPGTMIKVYKEGSIYDKGTLNITNKWKETNIEEGSEVDIEYQLPSEVKLRIKELNMTKNLSLAPVFVLNYLGELPSLVSLRTPIIALNDSDLNYAGSEITLPISGDVNRILHCVNWNFSSSNCMEWQLHNLSDYSYTLNSTHITFNVSSFDAYGAGYVDDVPPEITIVYPKNGTSLPSGTTQITIKIYTNENATCKYSTTAEFNFSDGSDFTTTGELNHSFLYSGLQDGKSYNLYYKCKDASGNVNDEAVHHFFSVAQKEEPGGAPGGGGGGGAYIEKVSKIVITPNLAIYRVVVNLKESKANPSIKIREIEQLPEGISKPQITYKLFELNKTNFEDKDVKNATIEFKVAKFWIESNNIATIYLARYGAGWEKYRAEKINESSDFIFYKAELNNLSYLAIIGEKIAKVCEEGAKRCVGNNLQKCENGEWKTIETCEYGCNSTLLACNPKPLKIERICEEGAKRCRNNNLEQCINNSWQTIEICEYGCNSTMLACNPKPEKPRFDYRIVAILLAIAVVGVVIYFKRAQILKFLKEKLKHREDLNEKISKIRKKIEELKAKGVDTFELEAELEIAEKDLKFGLLAVAKTRLEKIEKELKRFEAT